ncbi:MAG: M48 family metallopeptidase [Candidatus Cloacimonetes bacterium]|nr:M48 family metallopeptidase [Candidatus Cloacimonadota bacterium]
MAFEAVGLQTFIWNNNLKSSVLLVGFPALLLGMLYTFFYLLYLDQESAATVAGTHFSQTWHFVIGFCLIWFLIAYFFHQNLIFMASGSRYVDREEETRLYNLLENLCISRGITMPKLAVIDTEALNAFASGVDERHYTISVTRGLIDKLDDPELEAVLAHELIHIMNRDARLLVISIIFVGMIGFFAEVAGRSIMRGSSSRSSRSNSNSKQDPRVFLIAALVLFVGYAFALLLRFAISRSREFVADAGSVELTKNPEALSSALMKISGYSQIEGMPDEVAQMCIDNPAGSAFMSWFSTHPPLSERLEALQAYAGASFSESGQ